MADSTEAVTSLAQPVRRDTRIGVTVRVHNGEDKAAQTCGMLHLFSITVALPHSSMACPLHPTLSCWLTDVGGMLLGGQPPPSPAAAATLLLCADVAEARRAGTAEGGFNVPAGLSCFARVACSKPA